MKKETRLRFAPSPTGPLHIGGMRTALFNYLIAKKLKGKFILRIEDTDKNRFNSKAEKYIIDSLKWCALVPDESPIKGGKYGPYRQSERKHIYIKYAKTLIDKGKAYYAFDSEKKLDKMREELKRKKIDFQYNAVQRMKMKNSLTMRKNEVENEIQKKKFVIRIKIPENGKIIFHDLIRGKVIINFSNMDDKVLIKSDGMPTYHLANVVDDHLMKISHVIRGEEWLPSSPLHKLLYQYLGWENSIPRFAHLPLILNPFGKGKLSKRDGEKHGLTVFPLTWYENKNKKFIGFKEKGYEANAFINFIAFLGWNPGDENELFSMKELIKEFSIERIIKSGAKYDIEKAKSINQKVLKNVKDIEFENEINKKYKNKHYQLYSKSKIIKIINLLRNRIIFKKDIVNESSIFFLKPTAFDQKFVKNKWKNSMTKTINLFLDKLNSMELNVENLKKDYVNTLNKHDIKLGTGMQSLRLCITGVTSGPDLFTIINVLGKKESSERIKIALKIFSQ